MGGKVKGRITSIEFKMYILYYVPHEIPKRAWHGTWLQEFTIYLGEKEVQMKG